MFLENRKRIEKIKTQIKEAISRDLNTVLIFSTKIFASFVLCSLGYFLTKVSLISLRNTFPLR